MQPEDPLADEIAGMVDALLEGRLGPADVRRLEELVCTNAEARRIYLQYIHLNCSIPPHLGVPSEPALPEDHEAPAGQPPDLNETLMMPALSAVQADDEDDWGGAIIPTPAVPARTRRIRPVRRYAAAAAVLVLGTLAIAIWFNRGARQTASTGGNPPPAPATTAPSPVAPAPLPAAPQPVAHVTALADAAFDGPAVRPGAALLPGDALNLLHGAAEVTYANGAVLVVEGPASLAIIDGSTAQLDRGKIAARVPHQTSDFRVTSAKLTVTDLGTEFGVDVNPEGVAIAHVFEGRITVALPSTSNSPSALKLLERDQTVRCPVSGGNIQPLPKLPETFTRDIAQYALPLPLHSTGAGAPEGSPDPNWQFVGDSNDPKLVPRPATVASAYETSVPGKRSYLPNSAKSRWISTQAKLNRVAAGTYTFRTHVDLSGLDLARVKLLAHVAADDEVKAVRVNGHPVPVSQLADRGIQYVRLHDLTISKGLVAGVNTVEFDVWNSRDQMALRVEWDATVLAPVVR